MLHATRIAFYMHGALARQLLVDGIRKSETSGSYRTLQRWPFESTFLAVRHDLLYLFLVISIGRSSISLYRGVSRAMSFLPTVLRVARTQTPRRLRLATPIASSSSSSSTQFRHRTLATATNLEQQFTSPTREHVTHLRTLLSAKSSLLSTLDGSATGDELDGFNVDWMGKYKGKSAVVVKPKTTQEVADVMKYCYEQSIAIVPQGGNTGLVGTSAPPPKQCSLLPG